MMTWLSKSDNRNIVSGSAGSAREGGGMATKKLVTTKDAGFQLMADYINNAAGSKWTKAQCEGKYRLGVLHVTTSRVLLCCLLF